MTEQVCRCGRTTSDAWHCNHAKTKPLRCRLGLHRWSGWTTPAWVRWCHRCGQRGSR